MPSTDSLLLENFILLFQYFLLWFFSSSIIISLLSICFILISIIYKLDPTQEYVRYVLPLNKIGIHLIMSSLCLLHLHYGKTNLTKVVYLPRLLHQFTVDFTNLSSNICAMKYLQGKYTGMCSWGATFIFCMSLFTGSLPASQRK